MKSFIPIGTKVSPETYARLQSIMQARGLTLYDFLQGCCSVIVSYMDEGKNLSADLNRMMQLFEGMKNWQTAFHHTGIDTAKIGEAFYVLTTDRKKGGQIVHVSAPAGDMFRQETYNKQVILERFIELLLPDLYRRMRLLGVQLGTNSVLETLLTLVDENIQDPDEQTIREEFESNDWVHNAKEGKARSVSQTAQHRYKQTRTPTLF